MSTLAGPSQAPDLCYLTRSPVFIGYFSLQISVVSKSNAPLLAIIALPAVQ